MDEIRKNAIVLLLVATAVALNRPEPGQLAFVVNAEEFEDYLNGWLETTYLRDKASTSVSSTRSVSFGCTIRINGDLGQPQPVYLHNDGYLLPAGNTGKIHLNTSEQVVIACPGIGRTIKHPNISATVTIANATCANSSLVSGDGWMNGTGEFGQLTCSGHSFYEAEAINETCFNNNQVIRVGYNVNKNFYPLYWSCFDENRLEVVYISYKQNASNAVHQSKVDRPSWQAGSFYPGVPVNTLYTQVRQKAIIARLVGQQLANKYITSTQFLSRGHLAAKTDFVFATGQRATFFFINAAPQWQPFNAGNWNTLEQNLRARIGVAGYNTVVYTGTFGVSQLRDSNDQLVDVYLYRDENNNPQLPVPLYYYKVITTYPELVNFKAKYIISTMTLIK